MTVKLHLKALNFNWKALLLSILLIATLPLFAKDTIIIHNEGPCQEITGGPFYSPCHHIMHEEFFEAGQSIEAKQACFDWRASKTDPDILFCDGSSAQWQGGWDRWVEPDNSYIFWFGIFHFKGCPEGTILDPDKGCIPIEEDEGECDADGTKTGKSINTATGNEYHKETLEIGDGLDLTLSYNSHIRYNEKGQIDYNHLAPGWTMSINMYISPIYSANNQDYVVIHRGNGRYLTYSKSGTQWHAEVKDKDNKLEKTTNGWKFTSQNNQIETYNNDGELKTIEKNNSLLTITGNGHYITSIENQKTNRIDFENLYLGNSLRVYRYSKITDSSGREWLLGYSSNSAGYNLTTITYPDGTIKTFHYENTQFPHALTGITDRRGIRYVTYDYDANGRVYHEQLAGGVEELTIDYHPDNTRTLTNSRGKISTYTLERNNGFWQTTDISGPGCSNCSNANTSFVYDPATNDLLTKTVDGQITQYSNYDTKGQYGTKIEAFGTTEQRQTDYTYDARFFKKPLTITEPSIATGQNKVTTYTYDDHANILSMSINGFTTDGTAVSATSTYQYNGPYNQISQIDGPRTDVTDTTTFEYYLDDPSEGNNRGR